MLSLRHEYKIHVDKNKETKQQPEKEFLGKYMRFRFFGISEHVSTSTAAISVIVSNN